MKKLLLVLSTMVAMTVPAAASSTPALARDAFPAPMPKYLSAAIEEAAAKYELDPNFLAAMAFKESAFNSNAVSRRGAQGILQLMPRTANYLGVSDPFDARQNVLGGAKYVRELLDRFNGDLDMTLAAYNLGPERVAKEGPRATPGVVKYVGDIKIYYRHALRSL